MHQLLATLSGLRGRSTQVCQTELRSDIEGIVGKFFPDAKSSSLYSAAFEFLFNGGEAKHTGSMNPEAIFLSHLEEIKGCVVRGGVLPRTKKILRTAKDEDCLVSCIEEWDALKLTSYLLLQAIPFSKKRAIVATARDEGASIIEWIAYHRIAGFDAFFIYTNDNTDGSLELLETLAESDVITLIKNEVSPKVSPQQKCYEHSLYCLPQLRAFEFVAYLDIDEFFLPLNSESCSVDSLFEEIDTLRAAFSAAIFNWKWFGSSYNFKYEDALVVERFQEARPDAHGKSLSRIRDIVSMRPVHYPTLLPGCRLLDSNLNTVEDAAGMLPVYGRAQINHYWNKSFEEFALKKVRGLSSQGLAGRQREFELFFAWDARAGKTAIESMPDGLLRRIQSEHEAIADIPGVRDQLRIVRENMKKRLLELNTQFDLRATFERLKPRGPS